MKLQNTVEKLITTFSWDQKKVVDRESRLILRKIKETIHPMKNLSHINKIFLWKHQSIKICIKTEELQ